VFLLVAAWVSGDRVILGFRLIEPEAFGDTVFCDGSSIRLQSRRDDSLRERESQCGRRQLAPWVGKEFSEDADEEKGFCWRMRFGV
jgi:hypothetical protein